ncbi:sugar ABC transporter ATP-binding protein [Mobilicoccus caccae]|uniref:ABC transporter domain-containing protein n=1 Tax=Mobilicoccus caccae TaxID=1859295 RepID=A0ABQ6IMP3_9MICO|nr:sugar ABC transporter ATP-binding protein [Mobilicoccus caccae]GMA38386.1 hypothetical protein GCM10025883_04310 [Mobilicoccus caccae]
MGLIYISHRMEEVWELADRVTVLRDGQHVGTRSMSDGTKPSDIVRMMVGRDVDDLYGSHRREAGEVRLRVEDATGDEASGVGPVSFDVRAGEVVAMVGLIGAGRTEVARILYGADPCTGGSISLDGKPVTVKHPADAMKQGIGLLPESRKDQALFLDMSVKDNITVSTLSRYSKVGILGRGKLTEAVREIMKKLNVRARSPELESRALSGGNQQKLVLGRLLLQAPSLLILDEPTRGVDIGAKSEIYRIVDDIAAEGTAVLVISSELPEAMGIADRLLVMRKGQVVADVAAADATEEVLMEHATGVYSSPSMGN